MVNREKAAPPGEDKRSLVSLVVLRETNGLLSLDGNCGPSLITIGLSKGFRCTDAAPDAAQDDLV